MEISLERLNDVDTEQVLNNPFFGAASKLLLRSVAALANASQYPALLTCVAIAALVGSRWTWVKVFDKST
jgi:hypothetical protein